MQIILAKMLAILATMSTLIAGMAAPVTPTKFGAINNPPSISSSTISTAGALVASNNLSDISSTSTALTNLFGSTALPITRGGTGATASSTAISNIGAFSLAATSTPVDHSTDGRTVVTLNSGYSTSTIMDLVVLGAAGTWIITSATTTASSTGLLGFALEAKGTGQAMKVALPGGFVRDDTWNWTAGQVLYISNTNGQITATQPVTTDSVIRVVGYAINADVIYFIPSSDYITHS